MAMERIGTVSTKLAARAAQMQGAPLEPVKVQPGEGEPDCEVCDNMRFVLDAQGGLKPCPACGVAQSWRAKSLNQYSSHTGAAEGRTFDNYRVTSDNRAAFEAARAFAEKPFGWVVIYGQPGNGKSHLCAAVRNHLASTGGPAVIFVTMPDLCQSLKDMMDDKYAASVNETYSQRLRKYQDAPVLILDDLGAERRSDWTEGVLFELLDYRYRNRLPAMIATNYDPNDGEVFDLRVISRWNDVAWSKVIKNSAGDYRRNEGRQRE